MPQHKAVFNSSASSKSSWPESDLKEVVVVGRSNVGKSSFINALFNQKRLAYVGKTPGKTQLINFFTVDDAFSLVDVPGYGYAKLSKAQLEKIGAMMEEYFDERENISLVISLFDLRHGPTKDDLDMIEYLKAKGFKILPVGTKMDKVSSSKIDRAISDAAKKLEIPREEILTISSPERKGIDKVFERIEKEIGTV